ncbi:MAG: carboxypeptidase regulatory-like domain-containing protein [Anaeromyxobacter sp.]
MLAGCSGSDGAIGPTGPTGPTGPSGNDASAYGTLVGTVTDTFGNDVAGATVSYLVGTDKVSATTDANGAYSIDLAPGSRTLTWAATGYAAYAQAVEAAPTQTVTLDVRLNPANGARAVVIAARTDTTSPVVPGTTVTLNANLVAFDPDLQDQAVTYQWTVLSGPPVTFNDATAKSPTATLADRASFKNRAVELAVPHLKLSPDEPALNQDRYQVVPFSYEQALTFAPLTKFKVVATVGGKSFSSTVSVNVTGIPVVPTTGLANVPINAPVVLQGQFPFKTDEGEYVWPLRTDYAWTVTGPGGEVTLNDPNGPFPDFTPATAGDYVVSEGGSVVLTVHAGTYDGIMAGPGAVVSTCGACHSGVSVPNPFPEWLETGHKEVMFAGIMEPLPDGHYAKTCTPCHTVGNGRTGSGGFADAMASENPDFASLQGDLNAEEHFFARYPASGRLAGVQCENCHGPQMGNEEHANGNIWTDAETSRITYSASVCATCHARAPKHGRYTQWITSSHANKATVTFNSNEETGALSNSCACCHSAQGFAGYRSILPTANGDRSLTPLPAGLNIYNAQPITCQTCHNSHHEGDLSVAESENLATVGPTEGATYMLPSGFAATGVGKGALCIACHNSRQGINGGKPYLHEDGDVKFGTLASYGAPHEAAQGDVLMGRNAYWLGAATYNSPATRSKHSYITDTCVTCHMELTTLDLSVAEEGQTRHDFKATPDVCNKCHGEYSTESVQAAFAPRLAQVKAAVGQAILRLKYNDAIPAGTTAVLVANRQGQVDVTDATGTHRWFLSNRANNDAFLVDPNTGELVSGCVGTETLATCTGFLAGAPGVAAIGSSATQDATVSATGVNGVVAKALWNTVLVQDDASKGVHNPSFSFEVMDQTLVHIASFTK